jgi:hypothetical protein
MKPTDNYALDLYELGDNANLTDGYNHTVQKIDVLLYQMQSMITSANNNIRTMQNQIASLETRVTALEAKAGK